MVRKLIFQTVARVRFVGETNDNSCQKLQLDNDDRVIFLDLALFFI